MKSRFIVSLLLMSLVVLFAGCLGSGESGGVGGLFTTAQGGDPSGSVSSSGSGSAKVTINWPQNKSIPSSAVYFIIKILSPVDDSQLIANTRVNRPPDGSSTEVTINGIPAGNVKVVIYGYNSSDVKVCEGSSTTTIIAGITNNSLTVTVTPTSAGGASVSGISNSNPTTGDTVTITGSGFGSSQGTSNVIFTNNKIAPIVSWSDSSIQCYVPAGSYTGNVVVQIGGVNSNGVSVTVNSLNKGYLTIYNGSTNSGIASINTLTKSKIEEKLFASNTGCWGIAITPDCRKLIVASTSNYIYIVDPNNISSAPTKTFTSADFFNGSGPKNVAVTPDSKYAFVTLESSQKVIRINLADNSIDSYYTTGSGNPFGIAITPDGKYAYVTLKNNKLSRINISEKTIENNITIPGTNSDDMYYGIAISPEGKYAYVLCSGTFTGVRVFALADNISNLSLSASISDPNLQCYYLTGTPDGKYGFVSDTSAVQKADLSTNSFVGSISISNPSGLAVNPYDNYLYICNNSNNNVYYTNAITFGSPTAIDVGMQTFNIIIP